MLHQKAQDAPEASGQVPVARGGGGQATEGAEPLQPCSLCLRLTRTGGSSAGPFGTKDQVEGTELCLERSGERAWALEPDGSDDLT